MERAKKAIVMRLPKRAKQPFLFTGVGVGNLTARPWVVRNAYGGRCSPWRMASSLSNHGCCNDVYLVMSSLSALMLRKITSRLEAGMRRETHTQTRRHIEQGYHTVA